MVGSDAQRARGVDGGAAKGRGADAVVERLRKEGVTTVFTLSGNQIMPIFDAAVGTGLRLVHVRHEAAAVHMADAYGQLTGEPGVALVTAGPGFANTLSALYGAMKAESPMVLIAGHASLRELGRGAFQEMPQAELAAPFTKASWLVRDAADLGNDVARAMRIARSGRPGPVQLSIPFDLLGQKLDDGGAPLDPEPAEPDLGAPDLASFLDRLRSARKPLVVHGPALGRGPSGARLRELARRWSVPIVGMTSPRGLKDPALGALADVLPEADLICLLAKAPDYMLRFADVPAVGRDASFVHIDPEPAALEQARVALGLRLESQWRGDAAVLLETLGTSTVSGDPGWQRTVEAAITTRVAVPGRPAGKADGPLHPAEVAAAIQPILDSSERSVLVIDGGEFGQWAQALLTAPRRLTNGPSGAIGASLPFAIAARIVEPSGPVVAVMGDGTVGFHVSELDTAVRAATPLLAVVGNDACWNAEYQIQLREYGAERAQGCELLPTRYDRVAEALGAFGRHVDRPDELGPALDAAMGSGRPALVDVAIERHAAPVAKLGD